MNEDIISKRIWPVVIRRRLQITIFCKSEVHLDNQIQILTLTCSECLFSFKKSMESSINNIACCYKHKYLSERDITCEARYEYIIKTEKRSPRHAPTLFLLLDE